MYLSHIVVIFMHHILWKCCTIEFDKNFKAWNIAIRNLLHLPYNTLTQLLGTLNNQSHIGNQFYHNNFIFLLKANNSSNTIARTCIHRVVYDSNTCIYYTIVFYRYE